MPGNNPEGPTSPQRRFAVDVVKKLRAAGFQALWAGGCVRDAMLGLPPKDYDVATDAKPDQVIQLFGRRHTVPVGASFGVVMVLGPTKTAGQIEVATFRTDGEYFDGRRPAEVIFCSPEQDALRRDFTINGMFIDPLSGEVIDFVGGRRDLEARVLRAIGDARKRFTEDKLRMLRAVRFAATYEFRIEHDTLDAIYHLRSDLTQVSAERIAQELRRMLGHASRAVAVALLHDTGLLPVIFPDVFTDTPERTASFLASHSVIAALQQATFEPSLAALLDSRHQVQGSKLADRTLAVRRECGRLRLSNDETQCVCWLVDTAHVCSPAEAQPLHVLKPILADTRRNLLLDLLRARHAAGIDSTDNAEFLRAYLQTVPEDQLSPAPFVTGADLQQLQVSAGPIFSDLLTTLRHEQLDEVITSRESALQRLRELIARRETDDR
ncbi:MAG: CCA tRNA nucleotidyltransferase [Planctomycetaceae bacterium]